MGEARVRRPVGVSVSTSVETQIAAVLRSKYRGVDDLEGSPVGECTNGARLERGHSTVRYKSLQSPLDATPIVGARYNFLTCITTFVERDAAECVEIEHLRDECFAGRAEDLR